MESERRRVLSQEKAKEDPTNGHPYVEIGGIKWATMNIGANNETGRGLYFQFGDTAGYSGYKCGSNSDAYMKPFYWADYKFNNGKETGSSTGMTKYNSNDGKMVLEPCDDAATLYWGGDWRMPTTAEFQALGAAVNTEWITNYQGSGVNGRLMTDKTDSSKVLFFPTSGKCENGIYNGQSAYGFYWSSSRYPSAATTAYYMYFDSSNVGWNYSSNRCNGYSIRPVLDTSE